MCGSRSGRICSRRRASRCDRGVSSPHNAPTALDSLAVAKLMLRAGRDVEIAATGGSMSPAIAPDARLRLRSPGATLAPGDVISFESGSVVLTHRAVAVGRRYVIARGDALTVCDLPVPREMILGVVAQVFDGANWISVPAASPRPASKESLSALLLIAVRSLLLVHVQLAEGVVHVARAMLQVRATLRGH